MATEFEIADEFDCGVETYWKIFWDDEFARALYMAFKSERRVTSLQDEQGQILRVQEVEPSLTLPPAVLAVLGSAGLVYREEATFTKPHGPLLVRAAIRALPDKFSLDGEYATVSLGPDRCRRTFSGVCNVRVPLVGKKLEELVVSQLRSFYGIATRMHRTWITKTEAQPHP